LAAVLVGTSDVICGYHSIVDEACSLLEYDALLIGNLFPTFQGSMVRPSSEQFEDYREMKTSPPGILFPKTLKTGQTNDPETLVIHQKMTPGNNPEDFKQHSKRRFLEDWRRHVIIPSSSETKEVSLYG
jgi:hypothetical protein